MICRFTRSSAKLILRTNEEWLLEEICKHVKWVFAQHINGMGNTKVLSVYITNMT